MSIQRSFAQRNSNILELTPTGDCSGGEYLDLQMDPVHSPTVNVDVRGVTPDGSNYLFNIVYDTTLAAKYPGLEFTVFFDSFNSSDADGNFVRVTTPDQLNEITSSYHFASDKYTQVLSVTLKSNGRIFNIVSAGNAYWD